MPRFDIRVDVGIVRTAALRSSFPAEGWAHASNVG